MSTVLLNYNALFGIISCNAGGTVIQAFAKLYGTYEAIEGGWVDQALADLTGGIAMNLSIKKLQAEVRSGALWKKLVEYRDAGYLMGCGTPAGTDSVEHASPLGIVQVRLST